MLLEVNNLTVHYGAVKALSGISFNVNVREIVTMIGPTGAGKSTALKAVSGLLQTAGGQTEKGQIFFEGKSISEFKTHELVIKGISLVPEGRRVFPSMTVWENLEMGAYRRSEKGFIMEDIETVFALFPQLKERKRKRAGTLSSGEQQMLTLGRVLPAPLLFISPTRAIRFSQ